MEFLNPEVKAVFCNYPETYRMPLLEIRSLIFETAKEMVEMGSIEESLKWGQPSYSTYAPKTGTPIRLDRFEEDKIAVLFHCQTTLIEEFRFLFQDTLEFSKNRAIVLDPQKELPLDELKACIQMALTYRLGK